MESRLTFFCSCWIMLDRWFPEVCLLGAGWPGNFFSGYLHGKSNLSLFGLMFCVLPIAVGDHMYVCSPTVLQKSNKKYSQTVFSLESRKYRADLFVRSPFCPDCQDLYCHLTVIYSVLQLPRQNPIRVAHKDHPNPWDTSCPVSHMGPPSAWALHVLLQ